MDYESEYYKKLIKTFQSMAIKYSTHSLFCDFLELSAIAIQNEYMKFINKDIFDKYENRYFEIIKNYEKEDLEKIALMLSYLVLEANKQIRLGRISDILGKMFHDLELHNKYKGQFFSPQHLCDLMGAMAHSRNFKNDVAEKGFVKVAEPCCGSGAMILGAVNAFNNAGGDHRTQFMVVANDIDIKCMWMTFIQCSIYGIPAIVSHGDTITLEMYSTFYTSAYLTQDWEAKKNEPLSIEFNDYSELQEILNVF